MKLSRSSVVSERRCDTSCVRASVWCRNEYGRYMSTSTAVHLELQPPAAKRKKGKKKGVVCVCGVCVV